MSEKTTFTDCWVDNRCPDERCPSRNFTREDVELLRRLGCSYPLPTDVLPLSLFQLADRIEALSRPARELAVD